MWVSLWRKWSDSVFYNWCSELTNCNWRSCQLKENGWGKLAAPTLAASLCVDLSRCGQSSSHSQGRSALIYPHTICSYPLCSKVEAMENATMVQVIRILGECHIVPSALLIRDLITFLPEFIGELKNESQRPLVVKYTDKVDSPLQNLEAKLNNEVRTQQHLKLTQSRL